MEYLNLYNNNRQYILESRNRKYPNVSYLKDDDKVVYSDKEDELDKDVLDSLVAVVICDGKTNNDSDKDVIKNLVDPDNPFVLTGFNWKLNSGYGKYETDFNDWILNYSILNKQIVTFNRTNIQGIFFCNIPNSYKVDIPSFKVNVDFTVSTNNSPAYYYWKEDGTREFIYLTKGINILPTNYASKSNDSHPTGSGFHDSFCDSVIIKQIPSFQGALVTDGVDDMITSTKTAQEMLSGSNEITVVSMVHQITTPNTYNYINIIRNDPNTQGLTNIVQKDLGVGKAGIYGYSANLSNSSISVINNILGDKSDYIVPDAYTSSNISAKYSVQGWMNKSNNHSEISSVAWYWTVISKKSLTTDNINQIIKYYNLDKYIEPTIYYNVAKQGITNENHSEFNDKLIDYSGNNKDLQLYNFSWDEGSGIGEYELDFTSMNYNNTLSVFTTTHKSCSISKILKDSDGNIFYNWSQNLDSINSIRIQVTGLNEIGAILEFTYLDESGNSTIKQYSTDGVYDLPASAAYQGDFNNTNFRFSVRGYVGDCNITITQIPHGVLILDGVNDYGKVTGLPIYKDYTFIIDRKVISIGETAGVVASKSESSTDTTKQGAFLFEYLGAPNYISTWSFYEDNHKVGETDFTRSISYQSKYNYNGIELSPGTSLDSDKLWLGITRDNDNRFANIAVYSLMSFPYSMSEFLIERQLKMYNLGTLYPGMVEFRPIVKSNVKWNIIEIWQGDKSLYRPAVNDNKTGIYLKRDSTIGIYVKPYVGQKVSEIVCNGVSYTDLKLNSNGFYYKVVPITKSPQKIGITIEQNENYVLFNPVITSNVEYKNALYYTVTNGVWTRINSGNYINIEERIAIAIFPNGIDELVSVTSSDLNNISTISINNSGEFYYFLANLTSKSPQKINITIYQPPEYLTMLSNSTLISNETLIKNE